MTASVTAPSPGAALAAPATVPGWGADALTGPVAVTEPAVIADRLRRRLADPLSGPLPLTEPAVIGDSLRIPVAWCQSGPCIGRFSDPVALGEADLLARALAAGWRVDAFGRLICPRCLQRKPFWATCPPVPAPRPPGVSGRP